MGIRVEMGCELFWMCARWAFLVKTRFAQDVVELVPREYDDRFRFVATVVVH